MKRITPTRDLSLTLVMGIGMVWAGVAAGQSRHGGGGGGGHAPSYHQAGPSYHQAPSYHRAAPYRQAAPQYHQGSAANRPGPQAMPERYAGQQQNPAPVERREPGQRPGQPPNQGQSSQLSAIQKRNPQPGAGRGEHLAEWMNQHRNLTPEQQQQALDREPGFRDLPQATQQRYRNRLNQLNAMNPQRRDRILNYNERMEHLSVQQRGEVRGSLQQLGALPLDQRRQVAQAWRNLRDLPPNQQAGAMNSPQYQYMNPAQRNALNNLLRVSPLLPPNEQQEQQQPR